MKTWFMQNRQVVLRAAGTLLAIILLVVLLSQSGWEDVSAALKRVSFLNLALAFGCIILSRLFITARWYVLLRSGGVKIPFKDAASLVFTGLFANNFLPTTIGGDVVRLAGAMQMGYDRAVSLASIAADRVVNMIGMSLASPLGLWQLFQVGALQSLALAGLWQKGRDFIRQTLQAFTLWLKKPSALALALGFALLHMLFSFSANYVLIQGLGESLALWRVIGLFSLAYFVTLFPISINGYGVQELTVTFLLSQFGGVSIPVSATVAVLHRLLMMLVSLPGAFTLPGVMAKMDRSQPGSNGKP
ncbi:MAG: lysylphosphatidylglycerol synthase transmembrane domain-containing protein [Chloroflexi bacterium]|nr:lysylphosphatidylglycerol synthase transmembrane domain-containing protein [Chloroflexota bacterium]